MLLKNVVIKYIIEKDVIFWKFLYICKKRRMWLEIAL